MFSLSGMVLGWTVWEVGGHRWVCRKLPAFLPPYLESFPDCICWGAETSTGLQNSKNVFFSAWYLCGRKCPSVLLFNCKNKTHTFYRKCFSISWTSRDLSHPKALGFDRSHIYHICHPSSHWHTSSLSSRLGDTREREEESQESCKF